APWYLNQNKPSLKHHQAWNAKQAGTKDWYMRGRAGTPSCNGSMIPLARQNCSELRRSKLRRALSQFVFNAFELRADRTKGDVKTKFLKGACENCGATTHTKKDCVERPRLVSARQNGKNLMPDEYISDLKLDWDGKRDRWNGYQPEDYKKVIEEWESVEGERRRVKAAEMEERAKLKERMKAQKKALKKKRKQRRKQLRRQAGASCFVFQKRSEDLKEQQQKELMEKYGCAEHMDAPKELLFAQNDVYVEYARDGRVLKGRERALVKSKYEEDVLVGSRLSFQPNRVALKNERLDQPFQQPYLVLGHILRYAIEQDRACGWWLCSMFVCTWCV
ncbi:unnamed protein product, partial [Polarella glacialis]